MQIGPHQLAGRVILAPMAGISDRPTRILARRHGAALAVSEMVVANNLLYATDKTQRRIDHVGEPAPRAVQIAGGDPAQMAEAARYNAARGAQIVDINMGCPAKKVCNKRAGSALLSDEALVARILSAVVDAVDVPVTLKIRTGPDPARRNGTRIARIAEDCGIAALAVHGRTRADRFRGTAEYATIGEIVRAVSIPVIANGDIDSAAKAAEVLDASGAAAVMIGRAAEGNPWLLRDIDHYLRYGKPAQPITATERCATALAHISALHEFHGDYRGLRIARKHIGWYVAGKTGAAAFRARLNEIDCARTQLDMLGDFLGATQCSGYGGRAVHAA